MSPRTKHYGGYGSPHDTTGPRSKWDSQRPMGAPPPRGGGGGKKTGCPFLVVAFGAGALAYLGAAGTLVGRWVG